MKLDIEEKKKQLNKQFQHGNMPGCAVVTKKLHNCYTSGLQIEKGTVAFRSVLYPDNRYGIRIEKPTAYYFCGHCGPCTH